MFYNRKGANVYLVTMGWPILSTESANQVSDITASQKEWQDLDRLHTELQERTNRYVEQLTDKSDHLQRYVGVLTAMLDSIGDGLIVSDAEGNLVLINDVANKLIGCDIPSRVGDPWPNHNLGLFYADAVTPVEEGNEPMRKALQGQSVETVYFARASKFPDGGWFRVHATPVLDKSAVLHGAIVVFHDITEMTKASRQREALSALITHDLKNHLIGESQLLQMLIDGDLGPLTQEQIDLLSQIDRASKRQFQITNSLVEILRYDLRSEVLNFTDLSITTLLEECIKEISPLIKASALKLETNLENNQPSVLADERALHHVFMNLLGNAVKFSKPGGSIKIEAHNFDHEIIVSVSDNGSGMSEHDLKLLFTEAWPRSRHCHDEGSSGLGLYLCAKIMEAHKGKITCASVLGAGTTITLFFPAPGAE